VAALEGFMVVIPAKAGIQGKSRKWAKFCWTPAYAGVTDVIDPFREHPQRSDIGLLFGFIDFNLNP
jgi:hypothetical protein